MAYDDRNMGQLAHHVIAEGREKLSISGVEEVESFDEESVVAITCAGALIIRGNSLHIDKLSLDTGELEVKGWLDSFEYQNTKAQTGGIFRRLFG
ncbi:MAG: sporulation protein YabP [Oscillospiraceae bacterium]|nr:sporulation protein YabP [Oscillospiraceae bacterium]